MQIFGQVWLWSLGSFLLGALFTWLLLVRPARRRVAELEDAPVGPRHRPQPAPIPPRPRMQPAEPRRAPEPAPAPAPVPAPVAVAVDTDSPMDDLFETPKATPRPNENDTELSDNPLRRFAESTTIFEPPANLPTPPEISPTGEDWFAKKAAEDEHQITDVADDEVVDDRGTIFTQHTTPIPAEMIRQLDDTPQQVVESDPEPDPEAGRSLFEPVVPVPADAAEEDPDFVAPGPFGPGSAMPLPGGGSPAPEFNVKASVTALRYCTQDNPQFDRIVAEVWFRTAGDAERVGFRVLS
jgi:hypothetical protein